jgi:hypothetical protein
MGFWGQLVDKSGVEDESKIFRRFDFLLLIMNVPFEFIRNGFGTELAVPRSWFGCGMITQWRGNFIW